MLRVMGSEVRVDHYGAFCDPIELTLGKSTVKKQNVENEREGHWAANAKIHYYTGIIFFTLCTDYAVMWYKNRSLQRYSHEQCGDSLPILREYYEKHEKG